MNFLDEHRVRFGVEPICRVLTEHGVKIAPSTYYAFKTRAISQRTVRDQELREHIERVFWDRTKGRGISGARKVWRLLKRDGVVTARCTVERLMRAQGLRGVRRGKQFVTTRPDPAANRAPDHVKRNFRAECPNELWVVDFTYVPTWSGMASTAFVTDVFSRRIVGWRTTNRMPTELPLDALEMALWVRSRAGENIDSVIHAPAPVTQPFSSPTRRVVQVFANFDVLQPLVSQADVGRHVDDRSARTGVPEGRTAPSASTRSTTLCQSSRDAGSIVDSPTFVISKSICASWSPARS